MPWIYGNFRDSNSDSLTRQRRNWRQTLILILLLEADESVNLEAHDLPDYIRSLGSFRAKFEP